MFFLKRLQQLVKFFSEILRSPAADYFEGHSASRCEKMGDYGSIAPAIPHFQRMRSIRTPEKKLRRDVLHLMGKIGFTIKYLFLIML